MIAEAVTRIQAIEQKLTEKTRNQLQARLSIRACLKELRDISSGREASGPDRELQPAH
ncbi:MAG TPA: hypothetical protein VHB49_08995 [Bradyrhizobium sp.]|nr:hypothetical protein [Bradyrhizobium sp.]